MPIGTLEREVLWLLAANRNPESFVGGATVIHQAHDSPRQSEDIDLFHDTIESLRRSAEQDLRTLAAAGFTWERGVEQATFLRATVTRANQSTKLEWVYDSAFRFFPVEPDPDLGWRLNFWDAATNKVLACAGRTALRDYLDMLFLHDRHLHLGALAWAAAGKDPGLSPEMIIEQMRRFSRFPGEAVPKLRLSQPVDMHDFKRQLLQATELAETLIESLPPAEMGCFYLDTTGRPVCPEPGSPGFALLTRHYGSVRGAWPRIEAEPTT